MNKKIESKSFSNYSFFPKNRKGTHVEVIISFVIFIVFVVFLLAASRPSIVKQQDKMNLFDSLEYDLLNEISEDVKVVSIYFPSSTETCLTLDNSMSSLGIGERIVVENSSGKILENRVRANGDFITIDEITPEETLFKIYFSNEFSPIASGSSSCDPAGETIGLTKTDKYVFQEKIQTIIATGDYDDLKENMDVPENMDFTFGIVLSNGTLIEKTHEELDSEISTSIYVKDVPIEYIDLQGKINAGYLKIKLW